MSEIKLLPCPFCGGEAEFVRGIERKDIFQSSDSSDYVYVRCKECHAQTSKIYYSAEFHKLDEEYALVEKAWNTRKPMERIVEKLEEEHAKEMIFGFNNINDPFAKACSDNKACAYAKAIEIVKGEKDVDNHND